MEDGAEALHEFGEYRRVNDSRCSVRHIKWPEVISEVTGIGFGYEGEGLRRGRCIAEDDVDEMLMKGCCRFSGKASIAFVRASVGPGRRIARVQDVMKDVLFGG